VVTIRDVVASGDESQLSDAFLKLGKDGFVNYYGMQRFGTFSISTHAIGKEILLGNWEAACLLILSDQELVIPDSKQARQVWESTKDAKQAAQLMPRRCVAESVILRTLGESQKEGAEGWKSADYFNAIMKIPRNLRIMYGHAYQSYIWNCVTSRRLELFGKVVVVGDLVLDDENSNGGTAASADLEEQAEEFQEDVRTDKYQRAKPITEEDIKSNKYSIFDVVSPTPGFDIKYPENPKIMEIYTQIMGNDGLDPLEMTRKVKEFSFSGSYRKIVSKPSNLEFCTRHYDSPTQQLLYTDLELLNLKRQGTVIEDRILEDTHNGDKLAVIVKFQLDVSSYATMLLREVMRMDTGRHGDLCDVKQ
jgi:tRNA pseudouridine13 synthase